MFAATRDLLYRAQRGKYAVGHFNINNLEILQGIIAAAEAMQSPVILATSEGAIRYAGMAYLVALTKIAAQLSTIPVALHLDHGRDLTIIRQAIAQGYSSIMVDGSHLPFEKNMALTRKVVHWAHRQGISVEAELGTIGGAEETISSRTIIYTDPLQAEEFVRKTGCDFLAVAIGTSHGASKFSGTLQFALLRRIKARVKIPLVLHGASGVPRGEVSIARKYGARLSKVEGIPDSQIKQAITEGICKVNTDTDLRLAFDAGIRQALAKKRQDFDPRYFLGAAREHVQNIAERRIQLFQSGRKA